MNTEIIFICTPLRFYSHNDEALLFEWLKKIECIKNVKGVGRGLHLFVASCDISDDNLLDLMAIFDRYKFDTKQLKVFMTEKNTYLFDEDSYVK